MQPYLHRSVKFRAKIAKTNGNIISYEYLPTEICLLSTILPFTHHLLSSVGIRRENATRDWYRRTRTISIWCQHWCVSKTNFFLRNIHPFLLFLFYLLAEICLCLRLLKYVLTTISRLKNCILCNKIRRVIVNWFLILLAYLRLIAKKFENLFINSSKLFVVVN